MYNIPRRSSKSFDYYELFELISINSPILSGHFKTVTIGINTRRRIAESKKKLEGYL